MTAPWFQVGEVGQDKGKRLKDNRKAVQKPINKGGEK